MLPFCSTSYSRPGPSCLFGYLLVGGSLTPEFFHGWEAVRATLSVSDKSSQSWAALLFLSLFSSSGQQVLWEGATEKPAEGASASS